MKMSKIKKPGQQQQCRCCLEVIGLKDLWTEYYNGDEREVYGEMVNECFAMPWEHEDSKREYICDGCVTRLRDAVSFRKEILHSDQLLKEHIKNEAVAGHSVKEEEMSDAEIETEYLSIDYLDEDGQHKSNSSIEIKIESGGIKEESIPSKSGRRYTEEDFKKCIEAVKSRKLSQTKASIIYHVPRTTIRHALANLPQEPPTVPKRSKSSDKSPSPHKSPSSDKSSSPHKSLSPYKFSSPDRSPSSDKSPSLHKSQNPDEPPSTPVKRGVILKKRQQNLDNLIKFTNATPIKNVRRGYICYFCPKEYEDPKDLKDHTIADHLKYSNVSRSNVSRIQVISDSSIKLDVTDLVCRICGKPLLTLEMAFDHIRGHDVKIHLDSKDQLVPFKFDGKTQKCVVCNEILTSFKLLNDHLNQNHYKNFECGTCKRGFITKSSLQSHLIIHQTGEYRCKFCEKVFNLRARKIQHERYAHMGKRRNKCLYCDEKFLDADQKRKHHSEVHGIARQKFPCNSCDKHYFTQASLHRHIEGYHLMKRPYKCPECESTFFKRNLLTMHMVKHTGVKQFQCDICKKTYGRKGTLQTHMRIHANLKQYKCELCSKEFLHKCTWKGHMASKHNQAV
ncbi:zinc finger protein 454 isoform X1 [Bicyclus anynana]|uniref:Zinc finger protein 454 isoform X1 n=1 Tax=Bicyclus anynana TaxID=110368 RepID=A0A6J1MZ16_BICAN|nr:zinc finger protein 454 isoform X1 [Bicyclus anynana]